ncbi:SDR family oxidoreductase [Streptomyces sp. NPDC059447]|uniref:SDR family oxidoreductase n=1 Tax=Streptomyces sp. NPDC059447 TaxID=3346834 RepID=UPI0036B07B05
MNIGSVNARAGRTNLVAYSTVKAGLLGLTRSLSRELGPYGVCANTVMPGAIQVAAENAIPAQHRARPEDQIKRQRVPAVAGPKTARPWWRSSWAPPPRSSRANPSTGTTAGCCTETVNKQGDRAK